MPEQRHEPSGHAKQQPSNNSFFDKYADLFAELFPATGHTDPTTRADLASTKITVRNVSFLAAIQQLEVSGFSRLLQAAQRENHPGAFKELLEILIDFLKVETPKGVFTPKPKTGKPGRKISSESERVYSTWVEIGEPSPFKNDLARAVYGALFNKASGTDRRKMRDRCRHAVDRQLDRHIAKLKKRAADQLREIAELKEQLARLERG